MPPIDDSSGTKVQLKFTHGVNNMTALGTSSLKGFAYTDAPGKAVSAPGKIGSEIDMKFLAQQKPNTGAAGREQLVSSELARARCDTANSSKTHKTQPPESREPILQLCSKHVAVQVAPGLITA